MEEVKTDRIILHSDCNGFYASVECLYNPHIRHLPVAVGGDEEARHGIILAKNEMAKKFGIITGETIWQAKEKCPYLHMVPANFERYMQMSRYVNEIYEEYTDLVEPFGVDENWLDITHTTHLFGDGKKVADEIRNRIKNELGITVSIGVSYNKIFAKFGSDLRKPDYTTCITKDTYQQLVWREPIRKLLYVGAATEKKLKLFGIFTIGDLATADISFLKQILGVQGVVLHTFANGKDMSKVIPAGERAQVKSVGNSITTPRDLIDLHDVKAVFYMLADSVASRLREYGLKCQGIQISIRDKNLVTCERQTTLSMPTYLSSTIANTGFSLFQKAYDFDIPIRSLGIRGISLVDANKSYQLDLLTDTTEIVKKENLEKTVDLLRDSYGYHSIKKGILYEDKELTYVDAKSEHTIHPTGYISGKSI